MKYWIFLFIAIVLEVFGISVMNYTQGEHRLFAYLVMLVMVCGAYYFISLCIRKISIGVAYAMWEIIGLSIITLITLFVFDIALSIREYIGLGLALVGIILVNLGEERV